MDIRTARNGDVEIAYECFGPPDGSPIVLIPGSGSQMVTWSVELCDSLAQRGFLAVRMDNRDAGLSTWLRQYDRGKRNRRQRAYTMWDMADDVVAVIDSLGHQRAHLAGGSLGSVICQATAIRHPHRVASLTLLSAQPGSRPLHIIRPRIRTMIKMLRIMSGRSPDAEAEGQRWVDLQRLIGSPDYPIDEEHWRTVGRLSYERGIYPQGSGRHTRALFAVGDLRPRLATLTTPTLVVQGEADPLQSWRSAKAVADAIPGAKFLLYPGVGHDLPRRIWPEVLDEISAMATGADISSDT